MLIFISVVSTKGGKRKDHSEAQSVVELSNETVDSSWKDVTTSNAKSDWKLRIAEALECPGLRSDILDTMAGVPFEFGDVSISATKASSYHQVAAAAAKAYNEPSINDADHTNALVVFKETLIQVAESSHSLPALQRRLRKLLSMPCDTFSRCGAGSTEDRPLALEIDETHTSQGATSVTSSWLHQRLLGFGASMGISKLKDRANTYRSKPASVILGSSSADGVSLRDCFAFRENASVALRVQRQHGRDAYINHITVEQPPRWSTPKPHASPRRFSVFGLNGSVTSDDGQYVVPLGSFEYRLSAPHVQAFQLQRPAKNGLMVIFDGEGWSQDHCTCLYRFRAYESPPPSCVGARLARVSLA
jgi:hypothetical protein